MHALGSFFCTVTIKLLSTFNMVRLAVQAMSACEPAACGERGVIVNAASVAAFDGQIGQTACAASKDGVAAMTLPLAWWGIRMMAIAPGKMVSSPPRLGRPDEFAALVAHIVENEMLNGEVIPLDGALRMRAKWHLANVIRSFGREQFPP